MTNGQDAQPQSQSVHGWTSPSWLTVTAMPDVSESFDAIATPTAAEPARKKQGVYQRTEAHRQAIRDGWNKRRLKLARAAARLAAQERERENRAKSSSIDTAIIHHTDCLKTLLAAKALLK